MRLRMSAFGGSAKSANVRFSRARQAATGRGRVETEILRDHAVSAARKRMGERRPRYARVLDVIELVAGFSIVALQMRLGTDPVGCTAQAMRALGPHRLYQRHDPHDSHDAFEVVGQHMEAHLGTDARQPLGQEMR